MPIQHTLTKTLAGLLLLATLLLGGCATGPRLVPHSFSFDGWFDNWANQVDLLEYSYGNQDRMVQDKVKPGRERLGQRSNVYTAMPVAESLYVKWRIKATGEVIEDKVDLRGRLPANMEDQKVTFVIDGKQLYVYLVTRQAKSISAPPIYKTYLSEYNVTYEVYPNNTRK